MTMTRKTRTTRPARDLTRGDRRSAFLAAIFDANGNSVTPAVNGTNLTPACSGEMKGPRP